MGNKVTIIRPDDQVYVDGVCVTIECGALPDFIRAIQWDGAKSKGHIEFEVDARGIQQGNLPIYDTSMFQHLVDKHAIVLVEIRKAHEKALAEAKANV